MAASKRIFKQGDVTAFIRGVMKAVEGASVGVSKAEADTTGKIVVYIGDSAPATETPFDEWKAKRDARSA